MTEMKTQVTQTQTTRDDVPARPVEQGWGFEYRSAWHIAGWPLLHIAFKYKHNKRPVVAKGIIAIGQFGCGLICISQFGVGVVCVSQFAIAGFAVAQFAIAYALIAQFGLYLYTGNGQYIANIWPLLGF